MKPREPIFFKLIGGSPENIDRVKRLGWPGFVADDIQPLVTAGWKRVQFHNPYSQWPDDGRMRFDARQKAETLPDFRHLARGFGDAVRPLCLAGVQVIAYLGSMLIDSMASLSRADHFRRAFDAAGEALGAGCQLGIDESAATAKGSKELAFMDWVRLKLGRKVVIESQPSLDCPWLFRRDWCMVNDVFKQCRAEEAAGNFSRRLAPMKRLTGECIRLVTSGNADSLVAQCKEIAKDGHTVAVPANYLPSGFGRDEILGAYQ